MNAGRRRFDERDESTWTNPQARAGAEEWRNLFERHCDEYLAGKRNIGIVQPTFRLESLDEGARISGKEGLCRNGSIAGTSRARSQPRKKSVAQDFGFDSLNQVELVMNLEAEFDIEIADEDAEKMHTVGDVLQSLEKVNVGN